MEPLEWLAFRGEKEKEKRKNSLLSQESNPGPFVSKSVHYMPLDHMSTTPKGEINFCIYKLLRVSYYLAPVALLF